MGSLRRECMDHILFHDDKHLERVTKEYTAYFNQERPHQGIEQRIPDQYDLTRSKPTSGRTTSKAILGGLHNCKDILDFSELCPNLLLNCEHKDAGKIDTNFNLSNVI